VRLASIAALLRRESGHRTPPVRRLDKRRLVAAPPHRGPRPAWRRRSDRLVRRPGRLCLDPGEKGGQLVGPNPVDRGKPGAKLHILTDAQGLPLVTAVSAANTHDSLALKPLVMAIPAVRSRRGPRRRRPAKLRADKGYDYPELRHWLRHRNIAPKIARRGIESSGRLGRYRWKVERSISWLFNYRRLTVRYERKSRHFAAFLSLAAILIC